MGHTLEQYKGCDILDINPGACLWSQKLHEYLKPRSHILLEPNPELFTPYIDPLLKKRGSKYKLVAKDPLMLNTYRELVDDGAFPHQTRVDSGDPNAQNLNNTLLVTGSLAWDPKLPGMGFDSMAKQMYHHLASAAWSNDVFHAFGPVRTLFWVQSDDFNPMIAQGANHMHKSNRLLEMTQDVNLVVSTEREERQRGKGAVSREPQYEIESAIRALQSAKKSGLTIPPNRQESSHVYTALVEKASDGSGISDTQSIYELLYQQQMAGNTSLKYSGRVLIDCAELEKQLRRECPEIPFSALLSSNKNIELKVFKDHPKRALFKAYNTSRNSLSGVIKSKAKVEKTADIGEEMLRLEIKALKMEPGAQRDALVEQIKDLDKAWDQSLASVDKNLVTAPLNEVDDRINLRYPPHPRIQWDSRPYEPLMSHADEAWPQTRLGLVLSTPRPRLEGEGGDWHEWVLDFVHGLYQDPAKSIPEALDTMQHSMSDIIKDCPSLMDPDKGGRMQLKHFRVRMLTIELINDLVKAYRNWPFKAPGTDHSTYFRHQGLQKHRMRATI
jgi:transcription factor 1